MPPRWTGGDAANPAATADDREMRDYRKRTKTEKRGRNTQTATVQEKQKLRENELRAKRFLGAIVRGMPYGRQVVSIPEKEITVRGRDGIERMSKRAAVEGDATVWATLKVDGSVAYRIWPDEWAGPYEFTTIEDVHDKPYSVPVLEKKLKERSNACKSFEVAEAFENPVKRISKAEAVLVTTFDECWDMGVAHLKFCGLLDYQPYEVIDWPIKQQNAGRDLFLRLQEVYSVATFPSPEAVAIAALWIVARWDIAPDWFSADPRFVDVALSLFSERVWQRKGRMETRYTLRRLPLTRHEFRFDEATFTECLSNCDGQVITTEGDLQLLSCLSPIATAAMGGTPRNPRRVDDTQPVLENATQHLSKGQHFDAWLNYWYKDRAATVKRPLTIGPQKLMANPSGQPAATAHLRGLAQEFSQHAHLELLIMVWRDYLIPMAEIGNIAQMDIIAGELRFMVAGRPPLDAIRADELVEEVDEDDEPEMVDERGELL